jgi:hypothetical protein
VFLSQDPLLNPKGSRGNKKNQREEQHAPLGQIKGETL